MDPCSLYPTFKADWDVSARDASETCFPEVEVYKLSLGSSQIYTYNIYIYIHIDMYILIIWDNAYIKPIILHILPKSW